MSLFGLPSLAILGIPSSIVPLGECPKHPEPHVPFPYQIKITVVTSWVRRCTLYPSGWYHTCSRYSNALLILVDGMYRCDPFIDTIYFHRILPNHMKLSRIHWNWRCALPIVIAMASRHPRESFAFLSRTLPDDLHNRPIPTSTRAQTHPIICSFAYSLVAVDGQTFFWRFIVEWEYDGLPIETTWSR